MITFLLISGVLVIVAMNVHVLNTTEQKPEPKSEGGSVSARSRRLYKERSIWSQYLTWFALSLLAGFAFGALGLIWVDVIWLTLSGSSLLCAILLVLYH